VRPCLKRCKPRREAFLLGAWEQRLLSCPRQTTGSITTCQLAQAAASPLPWLAVRPSESWCDEDKGLFMRSITGITKDMKIAILP